MEAYLLDVWMKLSRILPVWGGKMRPIAPHPLLPPPNQHKGSFTSFFQEICISRVSWFKNLKNKTLSC